jgi:type I restriction enzyme S subunit
MSQSVPSKPLGKICKEIYRYPTYYGITYVEEGIPEVRGELILDDGEIEADQTQWRFIDDWGGAHS